MVIGAQELTLRPSGVRWTVPPHAAERADAASSGMMDRGELRCLAAAALAFPWSGAEIVVEIGTYAGETACFVAETLAEEGHDAVVLSIDPFERVSGTRWNPQGKYRRYQRAVRSRGLEQRCLPLIAYSQDAAPAVPSRIGLLIVDGNHELESVRRDLELYAPKVVPGGIVFMDDFTETYPGVTTATNEFVRTHDAFELLHQSYFAILQKS
ncbi:MAG: class I SAM-dependent methyltransferase [Acidimicrobiia bacterium]|nr:class I SAM-dependent methyltransferase [Acidimicrobiia bacterium]